MTNGFTIEPFEISLSLSSGGKIEAKDFFIYYDQRPVASVSYNHEKKKLETEIYSFKKDLEKLPASLQDFFNILEEAKKLEMQWIEESSIELLEEASSSKENEGLGQKTDKE